MDIEAPALPQATVEPAESTRPPLHAVVQWLRRLSIWHWALAAAVTWYTVHFARFTLDIHHGLGTSNYDLGL